MSLGESRSFGFFAWTWAEPLFIVEVRFPFGSDCIPMTSAALCLSLALQLPVAPDPLALDPDSLLALHQALQSFGDFQQPYSAPMDVNDPDAGVTDATVEVSAGCLQGGPQVITWTLISTRRQSGIWCWTRLGMTFLRARCCLSPEAR